MSAMDFHDLLRHVEHHVEVTTYGTIDEVWNVAIECLICNEVLLDFDSPEVSISDRLNEAFQQKETDARHQ